MVEIITMVIGVSVGFMVTLGWYKRGFSEMEKEIMALTSRLSEVEKKGDSTGTDLEVIKTRVGYMEAKIDDIHRVIMKPTGLANSEG